MELKWIVGLEWIKIVLKVTIEAVIRRCSAKKCALKCFVKVTGKHLCQTLFFNKVTGRRLWHMVVSCEFCKIFKNTYFG